MRYLVISDIHANLPALEAALADAPAHDDVICLGDLVGYGPDPNECVARVRDLGATSLAGNHDWGVLGKLDLGAFNPEARAANRWTQQALTADSRDYLDDLGPRAELEEITLVHASPREPVWEYVLDTGVARACFGHFSTRICLIGHSHVPLAYVCDKEHDRVAGVIVEPGDQVPLKEHRLMVNPGSVGQPRDGDPRASYAILDTQEWTWRIRRVAYPIAQVQARMREHKLPSRLIDRLTKGR